MLKLIKTVKQNILNREFLSTIFVLLGYQIFLFSGLILIITTGLFFLKIPISAFILPISFILSLILIALINKKKIKLWTFSQWVTTIVLFIAIYTISFLISKHFYDVSWDGQEYHQSAILLLTDGHWNPIFEDITSSSYSGIWVQHYGKASEILASSLVIITKQIETGKIFNLLFIAGAFFLGTGTLWKFKTMNKWIAGLLTFVIVFNPVTIYQSLSYYVDGQLLSAILAILFTGVLFIKEKDSSAYLIWFMIGIIIINLKFTGILFAGIACLVFLIYILFLKDKKIFWKTFFVCGLTGLIGILIIGFNPYVRNTLEFNHPFYPLAGENTRDIRSSQTPEDLREVGYIRRAVISLFLLDHEGEDIIWRTPFTTNPESLELYRYADPRTGGFGVYFMEICAFSFILLIQMILKKENKGLKYLLILELTCVVVAYIMMRDAYWGRYVPVIFIAPWAIMVYSFILDNNKNRFLPRLVLFLFFVNMMIVGSMYWTDSTEGTNNVSGILKSVKNIPVVYIYSPYGQFLNNTRRFDENNIKYELIKDDEQWKNMKGKNARFWNSEIYIKY